jgi:hypothetical protein
VPTIKVELPRTDYTGGELLRGKVLLDSEFELPCRGVRVHLEGREHAYWTTGSGKHRHTHHETRSFFDQELVLLGKPSLSAGALVADVFSGLLSSASYERVRPGHHEWEFSFALPAGLPSDYESSHGDSYIRYEATAYVDLPLKVDLKDVVRLTVYEPVQRPVVENPTNQGSKTFLFDAASPLALQVTLERDTYFPGEVVLGTIEVTNKSSKAVDAIEYKLRKHEALQAGSSSRTNDGDTELTRTASPPIPQGQPVKLGFEATLPADLYPTTVGSRLVRCSYAFVVNLDVPWAIDLEVAVPLVIIEKAGAPGGVGLR